MTENYNHENIQNKQKIEIEINSNLLKQLNIFRRHLHWSLEQLINQILKIEINRVKGEAFEQLDYFVNEYFNFDDLINELREIGD